MDSQQGFPNTLLQPGCQAAQSFRGAGPGQAEPRPGPGAPPPPPACGQPQPASTCFLRPLSRVCQAPQGRFPLTEQLPTGTCHMPGMHWELGIQEWRRQVGQPLSSRSSPDPGRNHRPGCGSKGKTELDSDLEPLGPPSPASDLMGDVG